MTRPSQARTPAIVWFRHDLRTSDNPALTAALRRGGPVVPLWIWSPDEEHPWAPGSASRWWLHHSLRSLTADLERLGLSLVILRGPAAAAIESLVNETGATSVFWNECSEPVVAARDVRIAARLAEQGIAVQSFHGNLLFDPAAIRTKAGEPYEVFTPFWKVCISTEVPAAEARPRPRRAPAPAVRSVPLEDLELLPRTPWDAGFRSEWTPGTAGAKRALEAFLKGTIGGYESERDRPDRPGTSRLSPHLHFGEIGAREVWHAVQSQLGPRGDPYLRQLVWREFANHLLIHCPHTPEQPLRPEFARFPSKEDGARLMAWKRGRTGYPIVDAGMRQLWDTGWMHNRVRMIAASFLVKDLLVPWQSGSAWFWDTLVDADLANNTLGWQWVAGCGADAAPFFRIFNPVTQGRKFDPDGDYVRRWVPELAGLPGEWIHEPWSAPRGTLASAGVQLGATYPRPIVDHAVARKEALEALTTMRR